MKPPQDGVCQRCHRGPRSLRWLTVALDGKATKMACCPTCTKRALNAGIIIGMPGPEFPAPPERSAHATE